MNRRNFLKSFSAAVVGTVAAIKLPLSTPLSERVIAAKETYANLTEVYEVVIDRFTILRFPKMQLLFRQKALEAKGYELKGKQFIYSPKWTWDDEEWDS